MLESQHTSELRQARQVPARRRGVFAVALVILLALVPERPVRAQNLTSASPASAPIKVDVDLVALPVTVMDRKGRPFMGLKRENFRLYANETEQTIHHFSTEDLPFTMGLVLDRSASMAGMIDEVYQAAYHTIRASKPEDEFFILTFNDEVQLQQDFSHERKLLEERLKGVTATGFTALYDAVLAAVEHTRRASHDKKALLVVTDGEDNRSRVRFRDLQESLRRGNVTVYAIGLFGMESGYNPRPESAPAATLLALLAEDTGGKAYFPRTMKECQQACIAIAEELRRQYVLGYYPRPILRDGSWRSVEVRLQLPANPPDRKLTARTRPGYFAPLEETPFEK